MAKETSTVLGNLFLQVFISVCSKWVCPQHPSSPKKAKFLFLRCTRKEAEGRGEGNRTASAEEEEQTRKSEYDGITMTDGWFLLGGLGGEKTEQRTEKHS